MWNKHLSTSLTQHINKLARKGHPEKVIGDIYKIRDAFADMYQYGYQVPATPIPLQASLFQALALNTPELLARVAPNDRIRGGCNILTTLAPYAPTSRDTMKSYTEAFDTVWGYAREKGSDALARILCQTTREDCNITQDNYIPVLAHSSEGREKFGFRLSEIAARDITELFTSYDALKTTSWGTVARTIAQKANHVYQKASPMAETETANVLNIAICRIAEKLIQLPEQQFSAARKLKALNALVKHYPPTKPTIKAKSRDYFNSLPPELQWNAPAGTLFGIMDKEEVQTLTPSRQHYGSERRYPD